MEYVVQWLKWLTLTFALGAVELTPSERERIEREAEAEAVGLIPPPQNREETHGNCS